MRDSTDLIQWLKQSGIQNTTVLDAMAKVPRDEFVAEHLKRYAFEDEALPIDCEQTISQPYVVARMTELILQEDRLDKVLEIGTGSGYQAAVLSQLYKTVYSLERIQTLLDQAKSRFRALGYDNIHAHHVDGFGGWSSEAPYDAIIVTAAAPQIPMPLLEQLADGAKMIIRRCSAMGRLWFHPISKKYDRTDWLWKYGNVCECELP